MLDRLDCQPIYYVGRELQRPNEVEKEHGAGAIGLVPHFVGVGVIEDEAFAFLPVANFVAHADAALLLWLRDEKANVVADNTLESTAVGGQVLARGQDRKERSRHARNAFEQAGSLRAAAAVAFGLVAEGVEEEGEPLVVVREM